MFWMLAIRFLAVAGAVAIGYFIYKKITNEVQASKSEHRLLKKAMVAAEKTNGRLTAAELAFELDIPIDHAEQLLTRLVEEGLATTEVAEIGAIVYEIPLAAEKAQEREEAGRVRQKIERLANRRNFG